MLKVNEVCKLTGVSVRTLHHYDAIGLLKPTCVTETGYRLYDEKCLERLGQIMLFRELEFSLQDIKKILDQPDFDREKALDQQIRLLSLKKDRLDGLIKYAEQIKETGVYQMDFKVFDKKKIDRYAKEAKESWGETDAYREFGAKTADYTDEKKTELADDMMDIFKEFGSLRDRSPADSAVQALVEKLQNFITENFYTCTEQILAGLGQMYCAGGEMTDNIDAAGGKGTAAFASAAIAEFSNKNQDQILITY